MKVCLILTLDTVEFWISVKAGQAGADRLVVAHTALSVGSAAAWVTTYCVDARLVRRTLRV